MSTPTGRITLTGPWSKLGTALNPSAVSGHLRAQMHNATSANGAIARRAIRDHIKGGVSPADSPLTVFIKGSSKPVVDSPGGIFQSIASVVIDPFTVEVGVKKGDRSADYARVVHEGARIKVTPAMRAMFGYLADVSDGKRDASELTGRAADLWRRRPGGWKALKHSTTHIRIPGRPFIEEALDNDALRKKLGENWLRAWAAGLVGETFRAVT